MRIVKENDKDFIKLSQLSDNYSRQFDYDTLVSHITEMISNPCSKSEPPKIVIKFAHKSVSNLVNGLRRRGIINHEHYKFYKIGGSANAEVLIEPILSDVTNLTPI